MMVHLLWLLQDIMRQCALFCISLPLKASLEASSQFQSIPAQCCSCSLAPICPIAASSPIFFFHSWILEKTVSFNMFQEDYHLQFACGRYLAVTCSDILIPQWIHTTALGFIPQCLVVPGLEFQLISCGGK